MIRVKVESLPKNPFQVNRSYWIQALFDQTLAHSVINSDSSTDKDYRNAEIIVPLQF